LINLNLYKSNKFSQNGEDGILDKLFSELNLQFGTFCEFGAWDGMYMSNTYSLYSQKWNSIYIEGNPKKFESLKVNITAKNSFLVCEYVQIEGHNNLDNIIGRANSFLGTSSLELLSIDIDSDDLAVFKSLVCCKPLVVVIEYNPTIPLDVEYMNPVGENKGNSARAVINYALSIEYCLVAITATNLIFIQTSKKPTNIKSFSLDDVNDFPIKRYFWGYDGSLIISHDLTFNIPEVIKVPWSTAFIAQPVPRFLRGFDLGFFKKLYLFSYSFLKLSIFSPLIKFIK